MALAFGGGVRPELGRTDYTSFLQGSLAGSQMAAKGGESIGKAFANVGQDLAAGVEKYQENKKITAEMLGNVEGVISAYPEVVANAPESIAPLLKKLVNNGTVNQREAMTLHGYVSGQQKTIESKAKRDLMAAQTQTMLSPQPKDDRTAIQNDYDRAVAGGYSGSFMDFQRDLAEVKRPTTTINLGQDGAPLGDPPSGMAWAKDKEGRIVQEPDPGTGYMRPVAVPIGGGQIEREAQAEKQRSEARRNAQAVAGTTVTQDLGRALEILPSISNRPPLVRLGLAKVPGTPEYEVSQFIESALSNVGLDRLQQMRETSPTGGALGQVPFQQQQRLEQVLGSLKLGQSAKVLEENMKRIQNIYFDIIYGDKDERAAAVTAGGIDKETSDYIDSLYHDLSFDVTGRPRKKDEARATQAPTGGGQDLGDGFILN